MPATRSRPQRTRPRLETRLVAGVRPDEVSPRQVEREFRALVAEGCRLRPAGTARRAPKRLLSGGYTPKHKVELFDASFYLTNLRHDADLGFFVAYVRLGDAREIHPRIFYKDLSLVWRSPSHVIRTGGENWIGKGEEKPGVEDGEEVLVSAEETTNLPLELQGALDAVSRRGPGSRRDDRAIARILRNAPSDRYEPYADFLEPRRRARANPANLVHGGKPIAWFERRNDPVSLRFAPGFAPDFDRDPIEVTHSGSRLYDGAIRKFRVLSENGEIQYQFIAGPRHAWIIPPQTLTTELSSYGTRTIDVEADDDLCVPGYEYHFIDDSLDPPELHTQIPEGYAGAASEIDPFRADASPWLEKLPVIQRFRQTLLRRAG